jgi:hypothetical protein
MFNSTPSQDFNVSIPATDSTMPSYATIGVPLGYLGVIPALPSDEPIFWVRRGAQLLALSLFEYEIWAALTIPRTIEALATHLNHQAIEVANEVSKLEQERLVIALPHDTQAYLGWHTIRPLALGIGTGLDPEESKWCEVWQENRRAILLSLPCYLFWAYSDGLRSLPEVVDAVATHLGLSIPAALQTLNLPNLLDSLLCCGVLRLDADGRE